MQSIRRNRREFRRFDRSSRPRTPPLVIHGSLEREYWRTHFNARDYVEPGYEFKDYEPAYRYGWESRAGHAGADWSTAAPDLAAGWDRYKGESRLSWEAAAAAVRDAFVHAGHPLVAA